MQLIIFFCLYEFVDGYINYCGAKMCTHTNAHTFCRYPPGPSTTCIGYIQSYLSQEDKALILARLNRRRSEAAQGIRNLPPAGDMLKLRWVEELAREAQRWADQCGIPDTPEEHDACRDLYSISVGQCVASVVGEAPGLRPETMIDMWYMQSMKYYGNVTAYLPPESTNLYYVDFAQMIWSRTYMVGCGRSKFMINWRGRLRSVERLVCNFAPRGPIPLRELWSPAEPASRCPPRSRPDTDLTALCTFQHDMDELYDEDNIMSLEEHLLLNTIMTIERNASLDNIGALDEIFLTKLAVATLDNSVLTTAYNSVQKRDVVNKSFVTENPATENSLKSNLTNDVLEKLSKSKHTFDGRPKAYDIQDLIDLSNIDFNNNDTEKETTIEEKSVYENDLAELHLEDITSTNYLLVTTNNTDRFKITDGEVGKVNDTANTSFFGERNSTIFTVTNVNTEAIDVFIYDIVANLNLSGVINESSIDEKVIDEYLSNPETARQLEESLNRMERKMAESTSASVKVRRELRTLPENEQQTKAKNPTILSAEAERNKSLERGPMLNMVLKYMPYLKQYEKNIIGDSSNSNINHVNLPVLCLCTYILRW